MGSMYPEDTENYYQPDPVTAVIRHAPPRLSKAAIGAYVAGVAGLALVCVSLALFLVWHGSVDAQVTQLRNQLATVQAGQGNGTEVVTRLAKKVTTLADGLAGLDWIAAYGDTCSTDLTGPNGPAVYFFPCTEQKP